MLICLIQALCSWQYGVCVFPVFMHTSKAWTVTEVLARWLEMPLTLGVCVKFSTSYARHVINVAVRDTIDCSPVSYFYVMIGSTSMNTLHE